MKFKSNLIGGIEETAPGERFHFCCLKNSSLAARETGEGKFINKESDCDEKDENVLEEVMLKKSSQ